VSAAALPSLGSIGAGGTIDYTSSTLLPARSYDHHALTVTETVVLGGTISASTGDVGFRLYDNRGSLISVFGVGDDSFTGEVIPAGTYMVQIPTVSTTFGGGDVASYTLQLTAAP
jgi:hypothetical protein